MTKSDSVRSGSADGYNIPTTVGIRNHDPTRIRAPGYSFGIRYNDLSETTPGPQYKVEGSLTPRGAKRSPSYSFGGRPKRSVWDNIAAKYTPGPNAYSLPPHQTSFDRKGPMYSFGFPYRNNHHNPHPAPNSYNLPSTLGSRLPHLKGAPSSTFHGQVSDTKGFSYDHAKTPGPAGYNPVDINQTTKRAPAVSLKGRTKLPSIKLVTPGPGAYDPGIVSKSSPRFSMGVRHGDNVRPVYSLADVTD